MSDLMKAEFSNGSCRDAAKSGRDAANEADATLRLLAQLAAPVGLEDRIQAGLKFAPQKARILAWPVKSTGGWMRSAAAAAIVFVVAGGGYGVYSRVQPHSQMGRSVSPNVGAPGQFATGSAKERPKTVNGPMVANPSVDGPVHPEEVVKKPAQSADTHLRKHKPLMPAKTSAAAAPALQ